MKYAIISGALALAAFTGCAVDDGTLDNAPTSSVEQDNTLNLLGCVLDAEKPMGLSGQGGIGCPAHYTVSGRLCLEQLVTGGWENVGGIACRNVQFSTGNSGLGEGGSTGSVSFYTSGRFYRARTWATVTNSAGQIGSNNVVSDSCKGDGGSDCF